MAGPAGGGLAPSPPRWEAALAWRVRTRLAPRRGEALLDLGCGSGHLCSSLAADGVACIGLDRSQEAALSLARRGGAAVRADVRLLPFEDGAFSWAVASHVLEFTGEPAAVLAEARRALRPGGRLLVLVSDEPRSVTIPLRPLARRTDRLGGRAFHLGRAGLESAAREAGLSVVSSGGCGHLAAALGAAAHALLSLVHGGAADRLLAALLALDDGLAAAAGGGLDAWAVLERPRQGYERGLMR